MDALVTHLEANVPWGARVTVTRGASGHPFALDTTGSAYDAYRTGFNHAYGRSPVEFGVGGTIPFVKAFSDAYPDASILLTGALDPDGAAHAPNESLHLGELRNATLTEAVALREMAP